MKFLDMSSYRPFRRMGQRCQTRSIREKTVRWVKPEPWEDNEGRFVGRPLARTDIEAAADLWRHAYPELYGSSHDFLLSARTPVYANVSTCSQYCLQVTVL